MLTNTREPEESALWIGRTLEIAPLSQMTALNWPAMIGLILLTSVRRISRTLFGLAVACAAVLAPARAHTGAAHIAPNAPTLRYSLPRVASGFDAPVFVTHAGDSRLFVVEQAGTIRIVNNGVVAATPYLSITTQVKRGSEEGLLGLAFEPNFAQTKRLYVYYTDNNGDLQISRFVDAGAPLTPADEVKILKIPHPDYPNHDGGWIAFGPDRLLYIGVGDGGGGGDPFCAGENPNDLRGKILRIDVIGQTTYATPPGNIFKPNDQLPEVYALGLRNPWRNAFDRQTGDLWIADVGQDLFEEISVLPAGSPAGANFGWSRFEGKSTFANSCTNRSGQPERAPVFDYPHNSSGGYSVTGGYVYRGSNPDIQGVYYFADFATQRLWATYKPASNGPYETVVISDDIGIAVSSFGEDVNGELYVVNYGGSLHRLAVERVSVQLTRRAFIPVTMRNGR